MNQYSNLKLQALAIGSLPHNDLTKAMNVVKKDFPQIPFFPQLKNINKNEDMIIQFLEGLPSFLPSKLENFTIDSDSEEFFKDLETFFANYEEIISNSNSETLWNYGISKDFSSSFEEFENIIKTTKPQFAKGQIVGPFTLATTLQDNNGKAVIYDETLKDIIVKLLSLKALWQIKRIKKANPNTTPIIFMDEPSISQLGTSAYMTISENDVTQMIQEISNIIKANGGMSALHCCGKCDWSIPMKAKIELLNPDAYTFAENFSIYYKMIGNHLQSGGKIAWGIVPTLDVETLENTSLDILIEKFNQAIKYLTNKGIDEKLIIDNSLITSSCGVGSLSIENAERAMDLVSELSKELRARL